MASGPATVAAVMMIRPAGLDDAAAVVGVWAETWQAAYAGIMPAGFLAEVTGAEAVASRAGELARQLSDERFRAGLIVADTAAAPQPARPGPPRAGNPGQNAERTGIIGYARFGPERDDGAPALPLPVTPAAGGQAELYAIYVRPRMWSAGAGRALLAAVTERASALGYATLSLWVLEANSRARQFYERAGFTLTGESKSEGRFADVTEVGYQRPLG